VALSPKSISRAGDTLRVTFEIVFILFVLVTTPLAWLMTPSAERERSVPLFVLVAAGVVVWTGIDVYRVLAARRRAVAEELGTDGGPRHDEIWDYAEKTDEALGVSAPVVILPFSGRVGGAELLAGVVQRMWASPLGDRRPDVTNAAELAMAATGLVRPPELYWAPGAGTNAAVAGTPSAYVVVLGESLLTLFEPEALLGVFANLLSRVEPGAVQSISSWDPPGLLNNSERMRPQVAVALYEAADAQAVLALRDTGPLFSALRATAGSDPFLPGLTPDQANLMWTWPSSVAPLIPGPEGDVAAAAIALGLGDAEGTRLEMSRIEKLTRVLNMPRTSGAS